MEYHYPRVARCLRFEASGLCTGIPLRLHKDSTVADLGAVRAQEDWRKHIGSLENYRGGMGPEISYIPAIIPKCLPDRLEVIGYANEFFSCMMISLTLAIDRREENKELLQAFKKQNESNSRSSPSGKTFMQSQMMLRMLEIDRTSAIASIKAGAEFVRSTTHQRDPASFSNFDQYLDFRVVDFGQMFWQALITFGMGLCIPDIEQSLCNQLCRPAWVAAALGNDLYSWDRELKEAQESGHSQVMNALWIIAHKHNQSMENAKALCRTTIHDSVRVFLEVIQETKDRADISNDLRIYIEALQYFVSGNLAWSLTCPKYDSTRDFNEQQRNWMKSEVGASELLPICELGKAYVVDVHFSLPSSEDCGNEVQTERQSTQGNAASKVHQISNGDVARDCPAISGRYQDISSNGHTATTNVSLPNERIRNESKRSAEDIILCELSDITREVIEAPARYVSSLPSKGVRSKIIDCLNLWLKVPDESLRIVKDTTDLLHTASLMLDDFQDGSDLRRGRPSAHTIFGAGPTVNSAFFQFVLAVKEIEKLNNSQCRHILLAELENMFVGQSLDLDWTSNLTCPSVDDYIRMVDFKTEGLFRLLAKMMISLSPLDSPPNIDRWATLFGRYFQIRDDYQNLTSAEYGAQKGFAENLDEGKYSLPLIHALQSLPLYETLVLRNLLTQRRVAGHSPSFEHKTQLMELMERAGSLAFTMRALRRLMVGIENDMQEIEKQAGENPQLRVMAMMLAI